MTPTALPVRPKTIPEELQRLPQWVGWRYRRRGGQCTKPPFTPATGELASPTDPATWGTFVAATLGTDRYGGSGVGFVLTAGDPYCAVDLDKCRDPETGDVAPWAQRIVKRLGSYTEVSPSGRGIRIIVRGKLPPEGNRTGSIEVYDRDRYVTLTGHVLTGHATIADRGEELTAWHAEVFSPATSSPVPLSRTELPQDDQTVLTRARHTPWFGNVYAGTWQDRYTSQSEADQAVCNRLAACGATPEQVDRIMRASGLYRAKWDRQDYRERTIARAFDGRTRSPLPTPMTASPVLAHRNAESCDAQLAAALARVRELEAALAAKDAELTTVAAERDRLAVENLELRRTHTAVVAAGRNKAIKAERSTAVALAIDLAGTLSHATDEEEDGVKGQDNPTDVAGNPEEGYVRIPLGRISESAGVSTKTAGRHIGRLADWGLIDTRTVWKPDPETGEARRELQVRPKLSPAAMLETLATINPDRPETWGGKRTPCPHCGETAGTMTRTTVACLGCGCILRDTTAIDQPEPIEVNGHLDPIAAAGSRVALKGQDVPSKHVSPQEGVKGQDVPKGPPAMPWLPSMPPPSPGMDRWNG